MVWLLLSTAGFAEARSDRRLTIARKAGVAEARSDRSIVVARKALETQFLKHKMDQNDRPARASPGGPDPHHH